MGADGRLQSEDAQSTAHLAGTIICEVETKSKSLFPHILYPVKDTTSLQSSNKAVLICPFICLQMKIVSDSKIHMAKEEFMSNGCE